MIYITRKEHFCASHKLFVEEWSDEKNREIFGKCSNPNGHGHNYSIYVTVKGEIDKKTGFLTNKSMMFRMFGWSFKSFSLNETLIFGIGDVPLGHHKNVLEDGPWRSSLGRFPGV